MGLYIFMTELTLLLHVLYRIFCPSQFLQGKRKYGFHGSCKQGKKKENEALVKLIHEH